MNLAAIWPARLAAWQDPAMWSKVTDIIAIALALSLPWSTSLVGIFGAIFVLAVAPTIDRRAFVALLLRPICVFPIVLVVLALIGMLWSDAAWSDRFYALSPLTKLLALPLLFYHFERSSHGMYVFIAFLVSCGLLSIVSWLVMLDPSLSIKRDGVERGIFVKNYIDQSQEFALCTVVLVYPVVTLLRQKERAGADVDGGWGELHSKHGFRYSIAHRDGDAAGHAGHLCAASPAPAN